MRCAQLADAGVPTTVMVAPVIPAINDAEIERILDAAAACGVRGAGYVLLRLPLEVRDLFREWLQANFPDRERHVFALIRQTRDGKDYDATFGKRMTGSGPYAWMIGKRFDTACANLGLNVREGGADDRAFPRAARADAAARFVLNEETRLRLGIIQWRADLAAGSPPLADTPTENLEDREGPLSPGGGRNVASLKLGGAAMKILRRQFLGLAAGGWRCRPCRASHGRRPIRHDRLLSSSPLLPVEQRT